MLNVQIKEFVIDLPAFVTVLMVLKVLHAKEINALKQKVYLAMV
jgi:hypothetical protein